VVHAESVVALEGPDHLAELAERLRGHLIWRVCGSRGGCGPGW
jgi:hypothetical protein